MAEVVNMPRLSDTMTEGVVAKWHKNVGDQVSEGDLLAEIETDKATMEFESFQEGFLLHIGVAEGAKAPVDSILAILGEKGEDITELLKVESAPEPKKEEPAKEAPKVVETPKVEEVKVTAPAPTKTKETAVESNGKAIASPLARKLADEYYKSKYGKSVAEMQKDEPERNHYRLGKLIGNSLSTAYR